MIMNAVSIIEPAAHDSFAKLQIALVNTQLWCYAKWRKTIN